MLIKLNGVPLFDIADGHLTDTEIVRGRAESIVNGIQHVDKFIDQAMSATPITNFAHDWVTGVVDDGIHPIVKVGESVGWAIGKGMWNALDAAGYMIYEKLPASVGNIVSDVVTETIKNCSVGTGCL